MGEQVTHTGVFSVQVFHSFTRLMLCMSKLASHEVIEKSQVAQSSTGAKPDTCVSAL